jgi:transmembrane sensor
MMQLYEWQPGQSDTADPDLFAPRRGTRQGRWGIAFAAAAALFIGATLWWQVGPAHDPALANGTYLRVNERQTLPDGSVVELKNGSRIEIAFTGIERRVRLTGEAHFIVAKHPVPFRVEAGNVTVQAVGTAFNVRAEAEGVDVLVLEGKVSVQAETRSGKREGSLAEAILEAPRVQVETRLLVAGQRARLPAAETTTLVVTEVSGDEMEAVLEWKRPHLQFFETPLALAVAEFNRYNRIRLVLAERSLEAIPIGGTFRVDNVEGFVRLLEITLEIRGERRGDEEVVLTR